MSDPRSCVACHGSLQPLWSSADWRDPSRHYAWHRCTRCGSLALEAGLDSVEADAAVLHAARYSDEEQAEAVGRLHRRVQDWLFEPERRLLVRLLKPGERRCILEVGCG